MGIEDLRKKVLAQTKRRVSEVYTEKDRYVIQAVEALEDIDAAFNLLVERVREWYGLHFPEINQIVKDHEEFLKIVLEVGRREEMSVEALKEAVDEKTARKLAEIAPQSMGTDFSDRDFEVLKKFAEKVYKLRKTREKIREYIEETVKDVAPNTAKLVGPVLTARLLSHAGGLKKLAMLPASTIQVLGAEKALFKHLTRGTKPPKHGILFQHPLVRSAKKWQRGKIARTLAAKIAIAAREDYFGGKDIADELIAEMHERVEEVKKKYPNPPKSTPKKKQQRRGRKK